MELLWAGSRTLPVGGPAWEAIWVEVMNEVGSRGWGTGNEIPRTRVWLNCADETRP